MMVLNSLFFSILFRTYLYINKQNDSNTRIDKVSAVPDKAMKSKNMSGIARERESRQRISLSEELF